MCRFNVVAETVRFSFETLTGQVTATVAHVMAGKGGRSTRGRSPWGEFNDKGSAQEERLILRLAAEETEDGELAKFHAPLATQQPVGPARWQVEGAPGKLEKSVGIGAAQPDDSAGSNRLRDRAGKFAARRCGLKLRGVFTPVGFKKGGVSHAQLRVVAMAMAMPDFILPEGIEALEFVLKAGFARRGEDGDHAQTETKMDDSTQMGGMAMRALKNRVVIELDEGGQIAGPPMRAHRSQGKGQAFTRD